MPRIKTGSGLSSDVQTIDFGTSASHTENASGHAVVSGLGGGTVVTGGGSSSPVRILERRRH